MEVVQLPEILNVPDKLIPIIQRFNEFRYFLIDGGRSSSKTQTVARLLSYLGEQKTLRIVCGREIQNSVEESVYTVFADLIRAFNLNYEVLASKIDHKKTASSIRFRGFREQGSTNIKGLEGVDILWVDESQAITKQTLDVIIPTIRKEKSKIFWTMNRYVEDDPVYSMFINRQDCLHIKINYLDNKFCPRAMILEADECKRKSEVDYNHIWLGNPLAKGDDYLFSAGGLKASISANFMYTGPQRRIMAVDIARFGDDETVYYVLESRGAVKWEVIHVEAYKGKPLTETTGKIIDMIREFNLDAVVTDDTGMGGGVTDFLDEAKLNVFPFNGAEASTNEVVLNRRAEGYFRLADYITKGWLKIPDNRQLYEELLTIKFKYKPNGKKMIQSKDEMRKEGIRSPNHADALMMALFFSDMANEGGGMPQYGRMDTDMYHSHESELPRYGKMG